MPRSKGSAAAIRVKAAHRTTEAGEIHRVYETKLTGISGSSGMVMTTKINSGNGVNSMI
jgi:hypothetical protein